MFNIRKWFQLGHQNNQDQPMLRNTEMHSFEQPPAIESLESRLLMTTVVDIELSAVMTATATDVVDSVPLSIDKVKVGETFIAEIWAQDQGPDNPQGDRGLAGVQFDLTYDTDALDVQTVTVNPSFNATSYNIDDSAGLVDDITGFIFTADTGAQPQWVRLASISYTVQNTGQINLQINPGQAQIARWGAGNVSWDDVDLDILNLTCYTIIPIEPNGDFSGDGRVNEEDLYILGQNWGMQTGATKAHGDANGDQRVSLLDLDILGRTWKYGEQSLLSLSEVNYHGNVTNSLAMDILGNSWSFNIASTTMNLNSQTLVAEDIETDIAKILFFSNQ